MQHILVIAEHAQGILKPATGAAAGFAQQVCAATGGTFDILVLGANLPAVTAAATRWGAAKVLVADSAALADPTADRYAHLIAEVAHARDATLVVAAASTFSKDILPRASALLDASMVSEVLGIQMEGGNLLYRRPMFAGNVIATVKLAGPIQVVTIRAAAFAPPPPSELPSEQIVVPVNAAALPSLITVLSREERASGRPDPTEARVVVSGGRALKTSEDFERLVGGLADALGGAVGSSRALVDSGITPNSLQIGQTGKVVAPDLYLAVGISGAIQHLAGMKDTKVIAAINKDGDAPIFEIADYGLVADVYEAVPEMIAKLKA
jgi:electron transfer flavoprotein alpha subunit